MNITKFALKNDKVVLIFSIMLLIYGLISFFDLPRAKDPGFIIRTATVVTYFPGASASRVEQLVTDKLEKAINEMPEIDNIQSTSKTGVSIIFVNILEKYTKMQPIWDKLQRKVNKGQRELPQGVSIPIVNDEFGDVFGTLISLNAKGLSYKELETTADEIKDVFLRVKDVAKVEILGIQPQKIYIEFNNSKLAKLNISAIYLQQALSKKNIVISGGDIRLDTQRLSIEPSGNYENVEQLKNTLVPLPNGDKIYLKDIANIKQGYQDPQSNLIRVDTKQSLLFAISMKNDGDILQMGEDIKKLLQTVQNKLPLGVELDTLFYEADLVNRIVDSFTVNLLQAMGLVILVMLFSLGLRTGFIVATLIPMSVLSSFILMGVFDIWIDQVSLASLIISLGLLVDNAIVMSESIMVMISRGKDIFTASIESAKELKIPLLTSSLTTAAAFLPIFLAQSQVGEYTNSIFKVVSLTLLSSWVLALTLTPVLSMYLMKKELKQKNQEESIVYKIYRAILNFILKNRALFIVFIIALFLFTMSLFKYIPKIFFPPADEPSFTVELRLPVGTAIETTSQKIKQIENYINDTFIKQEKKVVNFVSFIGEGAPRYWLSYSRELTSPEYGIILVNSKDLSTNLEVMKRVEKYCFENFPDMQIAAKPLANGPPVKKPVEIRISGKDIDKLFEITNTIKQQLATIDGVKNISDDWGLRNKKIKIEINEAKALRAGISNQDIAISLQTALSGFYITTFRDKDKLIPIILRSNDNTRDNIDRLNGLNVYSQQTGKNIPLSQVATVKIAYEESKIIRRDRLKTVTISNEITKDANALAIFEEIKPWLDEYSKSFELGYYYEFGGEFEATGKSQNSIAENLPLAGMIILLLMVAQFNSMKKPLIILSTVPLGLIGVVFGLLGAQSYFGFMTLLGIVSLSGIVINNAIVLIERIKIEFEENKRTHFDAIIEASISRFRPILLTTATTILGLLPLWLSASPMWESMAITIIFGLIFATFLTLGFVPVLYSLLFKVKKQVEPKP